MTRRADLHVLNGRAAGFVTRLFAFAADLVVIAGILALGGWIAVLADNLLEQLNIEARVGLGTIYVVLIPFIVAFYFVMFWSLTGRTIGKWLLGLRVVSTDGHTPTIGRSLLRVVGYVISAIVFWAGYLWVLVDKNRRAWHDHMASTWVVYDYSRQAADTTYEDYLEQSESY